MGCAVIISFVAVLSNVSLTVLKSHSWILIFSPDFLISLKSYIKGLPITGSNKNSMYSPLNYIFDVMVRSCGKLRLCWYQ